MKKKIYSDRMESFFTRARDARQYLEGYGAYVSTLLGKIDSASIVKVMDCFMDARRRSSTIFFVGNGGSAATASHFAQDLAEIGRKTGKNGFRTLSLTDSVPYITAVANDYGYDEVFSSQMSELFKKGDVLVAISASGNSLNILKAAQCAAARGGLIIGLVGFDGGKMAFRCDHLVRVKTEKGEYGPVEDVHMVIEHMITTYLCMKIQREGSKR